MIACESGGEENHKAHSAKWCRNPAGVGIIHALPQRDQETSPRCEVRGMVGGACICCLSASCCLLSCWVRPRRASREGPPQAPQEQELSREVEGGQCPGAPQPRLCLWPCRGWSDSCQRRLEERGAGQEGGAAPAGRGVPEVYLGGGRVGEALRLSPVSSTVLESC